MKRDAWIRISLGVTLCLTATTASGQAAPAVKVAQGDAKATSDDAAEASPNLAAPADTVDDADDGESLEEAATPLSERIRDLEAKLEQTRQVAVGRQPRVTVGGYLDLGFFAPQGNGSGIIRDQGNLLFPEYAGKFGWVFLGDLLAPTVNSRGEAADLGDAAGVDRFDSIHSRGAPGFIANEVNLTLTSALGSSALATASVNFVPRSGSNFALGDFLDVDLAQLEWMPTQSQKTSIFVGKMDSVLGIEYRDRKAVQRFGITPSLIARYTTGTALGMKIRSKLGPDDVLVLAAAVTNGSNTTEQFHFYDEIDTNAGKTASGRLALRPPLPIETEVGISGSYGGQDRARTSTGAMWFFGLDLQAHTSRLDIKAQLLKGAAPGSPMDDVYGLKLHKGGYLELDWMITPVIGVIGRGEFRDAFVWLGDPNALGGADRAYLTKSWRGTGGLRFAFSDRIILKAEYLHNGEYGGIPQIKNDVFTTSLLLID
ncbi:MAG TPA: hypothetical protein VGP07_22860 [Polyangia bacterium]|jgi:hypothetical protein